jgi:hypothetical protein
VIVWLWDTSGPARSGRGLSDDETSARLAAEECMRSHLADSARVEKALAILGIESLISGYERTGQGWVAQIHRDGRIIWLPFSPYSPELVAS